MLHNSHVIVADGFNERVVLLVFNLQFSTQGQPWRLCLSESNGLLFTAHIKSKKLSVYKVRIDVPLPSWGLHQGQRQGFEGGGHIKRPSHEPKNVCTSTPIRKKKWSTKQLLDLYNAKFVNLPDCFGLFVY